VLAVVALGERAAPAAAASPGRQRRRSRARCRASRWQIAPAVAIGGDCFPPRGDGVGACRDLVAGAAARCRRRRRCGCRRPARHVETVVALPAPSGRADWLRLIAARRSVRRYGGAPLPLPALAAVLSRMTTGTGPLLSPAVRIDVVVHAVAGLAPRRLSLPSPHDHACCIAAPSRRGPRGDARAAALDQDVIGDAAAVLRAVDRPRRLRRRSARPGARLSARVPRSGAGRRAGVPRGRARGLGACAVGAFYDDEAAALVGIDPAREWVVHFAALGAEGLARPAGPNVSRAARPPRPRAASPPAPSAAASGAWAR
jgi:hypothetical protein